MRNCPNCHGTGFTREYNVQMPDKFDSSAEVKVTLTQLPCYRCEERGWVE